MSSRSSRQLAIAAAILISGFTMAGCVTIQTADVTIELRADETWEMEYQFSISAFDAQASGFLIDQALDEFVNDIQSENTTALWERLEQNQEGHVPYLVSGSGKGFAALNTDVFGGERVVTLEEVDGRTQLHFRLNSADRLLGETLQSTFTVRAGRVLESNGAQTTQNSVTWTNTSGPMEAVFLLPSGVNIAGLVVFLAGGALIAIAVRQWRRSRPEPLVDSSQDASSVLDRVVRPAPYCVYCGAQIPVDAKFCPHCGKHPSA